MLFLTAYKKKLVCIAEHSCVRLAYCLASRFAFSLPYRQHSSLQHGDYLCEGLIDFSYNHAIKDSITPGCYTVSTGK
jgi:hypothetical protein